jgi:hypothetical protein
MRDAWIIIGESVGKLIVFLVTIVSIFLLYVLLGDKPFGFQIATLIAYSVSVFTFVFFRWKGLNKAYSLRDKAVRRQIPRLLAIHGAFLVLVFSILALASYLRPGLPSGWLTENTRYHSWFSSGLIWIFTLVWLAQVYISRGILSRRNRMKKQQMLG